MKSRRMKNAVPNVITSKLFEYIRRILRQRLESFVILTTHQVSQIVVQENNLIREQLPSMEYKDRLRNVAFV
jgi:hypothetical protein